MHEAELYVAAGMTPLDALRAATLQPARMLGVEKEVGSLTAGYYADLIALDSNPAQDIRALRTINFVMKGGQVIRQRVERTEKQAPLSVQSRIHLFLLAICAPAHRQISP